MLLYPKIMLPRSHSRRWKPVTTTSSAGLMISREFDKLFNDLGSASSRHRNLLNIAYRQTKINKEFCKISTTSLTEGSCQKKNRFFLGDLSQIWVGGVADSQTRSKPFKKPPNCPENRLFRPKFHLSISQISQKPWGGWVGG